MKGDVCMLVICCECCEMLPGDSGCLCPLSTKEDVAKTLDDGVDVGTN